MASIIVNNYNYECFLQEAIDSVLNQTYSNIEVIVVDDGSTDNSREIIASYGDRITPLLKENGGQTSAFNTGFRSSHGQVVLFVDADDKLYSNTVEKVMSLFDESDVVHVHWPLREVDEHGRKTGHIWPRDTLPEGNLRELVVDKGPEGYLCSPTTGNAWARRFLERVFPMPEVEREFGIGSASADAYLAAIAPLFGHIKVILQPQGIYRIHGRNDYAGVGFDEKLRRNLLTYDHRCAALAKYCRNMGITADPETWKKNSWVHRVFHTIKEIVTLVPANEAFILVDENQLALDAIASRRAIPFLERDGQFWGRPPDDETAIQELERLRHNGANFIVFVWPAFWWLNYYVELNSYLRSKYKCVLENDRIVVFDLRTEL